MAVRGPFIFTMTTSRLRIPHSVDGSNTILLLMDIGVLFVPIVRTSTHTMIPTLLHIGLQKEPLELFMTASWDNSRH